MQATGRISVAQCLQSRPSLRAICWRGGLWNPAYTEVVSKQLADGEMHFEDYSLLWNEKDRCPFVTEYSVLYSQTVRAGRITGMIESSPLAPGQTEALGRYLVCPRSQSWFVAVAGQEPSCPFQPAFRHGTVLPLFWSAHLIFSLNLIFPISPTQPDFYKQEDGKATCYWAS